jgi:hypothetical protein
MKVRTRERRVDFSHGIGRVETVADQRAMHR